MDMTNKPVISSTGLFTPDESITNEELVASFKPSQEAAAIARPSAERAAWGPRGFGQEQLAS